ncbi:MAG: acyl-CoA thioesterase [Bryobacteraceae bacterium]|nr:acyl-CoA thioesterase [Bryobacteraceae bacterium]
MSDRFRYYLRVRYGECDAQKVVFNPRYADYIDLAVTEFFKALGHGQSLLNGEFDFQLVKQTIEWKASARFDQVLELSLQTARLGNTSFTVATDFRIAGEDRVIVAAETVYVLVDAESLQKMTIPPHLREALEKGAPGAVTDHAAYRVAAPA